MHRMLLPLLAIMALVVSMACAPADQPAPGAPAPGLADGDVKTSNPGQQTGRLIARDANARLVVRDVEKTVAGVTDMARETGGWVVSSSVTGVGDGSTGRVVIRVPAAQLDAVLERLRGMAVRVDALDTTSTDVTAEYTDLESRLRNLQATEKQLLDIMDRAGSVQDVLGVQRELTNTRGEIERLQGQMRLIEQSVAMSKVSVSLEPAVDTSPLLRRDWSAPEQVRTAVRALADTGIALASLAIWIVVFTPLWIVIGLAVWGVNRYYSRRVSRMPPAATPPEAAGS